MKKKTSEMTIAELRTRAAEIRTEVNAEGADLDALEADPLMAEVLGPHIYTQYIAGKEKEWEEYCTRVSSWEIAKYMVLY